MSVFPTQYSVLKADAVGAHIAQQYALNVVRCSLIVHNVSDAYLVETTAGNYVFKIYRSSHRSETEIRGEAELLTLLHKEGASVAYTLPNSNGNMLTSFNAAEGIRFGMLFTYAQGAPVYDLNDEQLKLLGHEMALLHTISEGINLKNERASYNEHTTLTQPLETIKPAFKNLPDEYARLTQITQYVSGEIKKLPLETFATGYCQYDFLPKNFHFAGNNKLTFFDFDFAGKGYLINDITTFYIHYFFDVTYGKRTRDEADRCFGVFLQSYKATRFVSNTELKAMKLFGVGFWMFYFGFHQQNFDDWSNAFFTPRFIKERVSLIEKWMDYADLININAF